MPVYTLCLTISTSYSSVDHTSFLTLSVTIQSYLTPAVLFLWTFLLFLPPGPRAFITRFFILGDCSWFFFSLTQSCLRLALKQPEPLPTSSTFFTLGECTRQMHFTDMPPNLIASSRAAVQVLFRLKESTSPLCVVVWLLSKVSWKVRSTMSPGLMSLSRYSLLLIAFSFSSSSMTVRTQCLKETGLNSGGMILGQTSSGSSHYGCRGFLDLWNSLCLGSHSSLQTVLSKGDRLGVYLMTQPWCSRVVRGLDEPSRSDEDSLIIYYQL